MKRNNSFYKKLASKSVGDFQVYTNEYLEYLKWRDMFSDYERKKPTVFQSLDDAKVTIIDGEYK